MTIVKIPCYCATLRQATRALTMFYDEKLSAAGLRVTQFTILQALELLGTARNRDLESALAMDQTTLTRSLAILSKRRFIEVTARPSGRERFWALSRTGKNVLEIAKPLWETAQAATRSKLGASQTRHLHQDVFSLAAAFS